MKEDEKVKYTFTGKKGNTVTDYVIEGQKVRERIVKIKVGSKVESNHQPVEIRIKSKVVNRRGSSKTKKKRWK